MLKKCSRIYSNSRTGVHATQEETPVAKRYETMFYSLELELETE